MDLKATLRDVPDFPKPGILFKDITPLLKHPAALKEVEDRLTAAFQDRGITAVLGIESRGFLFGVLLARRLGVGFVPVRKAGKLPADTIAESYALEYGEATLELHTDAVGPKDTVVIVDDLLATGGTAAASVRLARKLGATVAGVAFVIELTFLNGRAPLDGIPVTSLITVD